MYERKKDKRGNVTTHVSSDNVVVRKVLGDRDIAVSDGGDDERLEGLGQLVGEGVVGGDHLLGLVVLGRVVTGLGEGRVVIWT